MHNSSKDECMKERFSWKKIYVSLLIEDDELLKKCKEIWDKLSNSIKKGFELVYNGKYPKAKIKSYKWKVRTNFHVEEQNNHDDKLYFVIKKNYHNKRVFFERAFLKMCFLREKFWEFLFWGNNFDKCLIWLLVVMVAVCDGCLLKVKTFSLSNL